MIRSVSRNAGTLEACNISAFDWMALSKTAVHPSLQVRLCNIVLIYLTTYLSVHKTITRDMERRTMRCGCILLAKATPVLSNEPDR